MSLPRLMGVLNVTPDSFSDGGRYADVEAALAHAIALVDAGADILDIGGESTRPGAAEVAVDVEIDRVVPVISAIRGHYLDAFDPPAISIDTRKPEVARKAMGAGADIWNDVSALTFDVNSIAVAADLGCPVILMHAQGRPETMQIAPHYDDPVDEIAAWLESRVEAAILGGVIETDITLDPGIGFGKRLSDNLAILASVGRFRRIGFPVLIGASRKSFMAKIDGSAVDDRLGGSVAAALSAARQGADILRVHDVAETRQALLIDRAIADAAS